MIGTDGGLLNNPLRRLPASDPAPLAPAPAPQKHARGLYSQEAIFLAPGERMDVVNARGAAATLLVLGLDTLRLPVVSGVLVPSIDATFFAVSDPAGNLDRSLPCTGLPSGTALYLQAAFMDPGSPRGVGLSNALRVNIP